MQISSYSRMTNGVILQSALPAIKFRRIIFGGCQPFKIDHTIVIGPSSALISMRRDGWGSRSD
jgi:hypothetical protein